MAMMTNTFQSVRKAAELEFRLLIARAVLRHELLYFWSPPEAKFAGTQGLDGKFYHSFLHVKQDPDGEVHIPLLLAQELSGTLLDNGDDLTTSPDFEGKDFCEFKNFNIPFAVARAGEPSEDQDDANSDCPAILPRGHSRVSKFSTADAGGGRHLRVAAVDDDDTPCKAADEVSRACSVAENSTIAELISTESTYSAMIANASANPLGIGFGQRLPDHLLQEASEPSSAMPPMPSMPAMPPVLKRAMTHGNHMLDNIPSSARSVGNRVLTSPSKLVMDVRRGSCGSDEHEKCESRGSHRKRSSSN